MEIIWKILIILNLLWTLRIVLTGNNAFDDVEKAFKVLSKRIDTVNQRIDRVNRRED